MLSAACSHLPYPVTMPASLSSTITPASEGVYLAVGELADDVSTLHQAHLAVQTQTRDASLVNGRFQHVQCPSKATEYNGLGAAVAAAGLILPAQQGHGI